VKSAIRQAAPERKVVKRVHWATEGFLDNSIRHFSVEEISARSAGMCWFRDGPEVAAVKSVWRGVDGQLWQRRVDAVLGDPFLEGCVSLAWSEGLFECMYCHACHDEV
jgi:hypothetical protein